MKVLANNLRFPEGPVALKDGSVCVAEIAAGRISRIHPSGAVETVAETGGGPNGMALGPDGALYVCNNGGFMVRDVDGECHVLFGQVPASYTTGSIQRVELGSGKVDTLYTHCGDFPLSAPNDIVFDAHGGFYFTDYGKVRARSRDTGSLYYATPDGKSINAVAFPLLNPNGIGLAPDQRTLYVAETETSRLWQFPIEGAGKLGRTDFPSPHGGSLVCGLPGYQRLDSLAVQEDGSICIGTLITGCISIISPAGHLSDTVTVPDSLPTNLCFGIENPRKLYVTLSTTGRLVELDWAAPGLPLNF